MRYLTELVFISISRPVAEQSKRLHELGLEGYEVKTSFDRGGDTVLVMQIEIPERQAERRSP